MERPLPKPAEQRLCWNKTRFYTVKQSLHFFAVLADLSHPNSWWCSRSATLQGRSIWMLVLFYLSTSWLCTYINLNKFIQPLSTSCLEQCKQTEQQKNKRASLWNTVLMLAKECSGAHGQSAASCDKTMGWQPIFYLRQWRWWVNRRWWNSCRWTRPGSPPQSF